MEKTKTLPKTPPPRLPNPFRGIMEGEEWVGDREVWNRLEGKLEGVKEGTAAAILIEGMRGVGKTKLLRKLAEACRRRKMLTVQIRLHEGDDERAVVRKITEQLRTNLAESGIRINRIRVGLSHLVERLEAILPKESDTVALLLDDLDELRDAQNILAKISDGMEWKGRRRGWLIAATGMCLATPCRFERYGIAPLGKAEAMHVLAQALEKTHLRWGEECLQTVVAESGGNPQMLLTMARILYDQLPAEEKRLTKAHYLDSAHRIRQEIEGVFDELYYRTSKQERRLLGILARKEPLSVTEMARSARLPLNNVTTMMLRLLRKGSVARVERGSYRLFSPLYGRYVLSR